MTHTTDAERAHALAEKHGATSYRNRADTSNPAFGFTLGQLEALISEVEQAARRAPVGVVPQEIDKLREELAEETEATNNWRRLALQFDNHRMQAIGHLKAMLTDPKGSEANALEFIKAAPLNGEAVLAQRIAALAAAPQPPEGLKRESPTSNLETAPVQMPTPDGYIMDSLPNGRLEYKRGPLSQMDSICNSTMPVYEYGTVRQLLAAHGIK